MIFTDFGRQVLLAATGGSFACFALWATFSPKSLAATLGYTLQSKNAISEFHAIYVGVFIAQACLCALALARIEDAAIGNLVAVFLLGHSSWSLWGASFSCWFNPTSNQLFHTACLGTSQGDR